MKQGFVVGGVCAALGLGLAAYAAFHSMHPGPALAKEPEADPNALGPNDESLAPILRTSPQLGPLLDKAVALRLQVLISVPVIPAAADESQGVPGLQRSGYRVDAEYFYPASAIKICTAVAALEKLGTLRADAGVKEFGTDTPLRIFAAAGAPPQERDGSNLDGGRITVGHEVRKALIVSSNESFNRLLDFVGYDEFDERMKRDGFASVQAKHYLGAAVGAVGDAKQSPRIQLVAGDAAPFDIGAREATRKLAPSSVPGLMVGGSYLDDKGQKVSGPMSFAEKNRVSLRDLQDMLIAVVKPELLPLRRVELPPDERAFLVKVLGTPPSESKNPVYDADTQPDSLHRPLLLAVRKALPGHRIRSYEKNGQAYAFVTQNVYLVDETTNRSVFVAAAAYVNGGGTMNQEQYRYDDVTQPLFDGLADVIAKTYLK